MAQPKHSETCVDIRTAYCGAVTTALDNWSREFESESLGQLSAEL